MDAWLYGVLRSARNDHCRKDDRASVAAELDLRPGTLNVRLLGFADCSCPPVSLVRPVDGTDCGGRSHAD
ncbi:hypothetical protein [Aliiroseovarius sediminilitoris]|uniref:hypothetical protein n=1 Tax=Aliiroseovarius sediminilitoris TaxID=1173584 RepID=UPI00115FA4F5|nr:hypothetical protein [Aliiroseovarius sediminilitoris]